MKPIKLLLIFLVLLSSSCDSPMETAVKQKLSQIYGEEFIVFYDSYSMVLRTHQYQAAPARNPKLVFGGKHNESFSFFSSNYASKYLAERFSREVRLKLEKESPAWVFSRLYFDDTVLNRPHISVDGLDLEKIITSSSPFGWDMVVYLFMELNGENKTKLDPLYQILQQFTRHPDASFALYLYIWDPKFLDSHSFDDFDFDRRRSGFPSTEHWLQETAFIYKRVNLFFETKRPHVDLTLDSLYQHLQDVSKESFRVPPTNLNYLLDKDYLSK